MGVSLACYAAVRQQATPIFGLFGTRNYCGGGVRLKPWPLFGATSRLFWAQSASTNENFERLNVLLITQGFVSTAGASNTMSSIRVPLSFR